jgi:CRP/FNR family cyclic AMP-dependent transcriptional regulator
MNFDLETILGMLDAGLTPVELLGIILGLSGPLLILASFAVKRMIPLRTLALLGNVVLLFYGLIVYGLIPTQLPSLVLSCILIPINAYRLWEIKKLSADIAQVTQDSPFTQWLLPHMRNRSFKAGEVLFHKGDTADRLIYLSQGQLRMVEIGETLGAGALIGEIGLFSPEKKRTQTVVCETDAELYEMTDEMIFQLYYQNPKLGFYFMRLVVARLLKDIQRQAAVAGRG